ncbi:MAG: cupin domain-containing protein [Woeseiaceae bacterium]|nr:cupin domain-containing protein [Woeseiaceae bacterium]
MNDYLIPGRADVTEILTRERCHIREILNDASEPELSVAAARVEPGITTELHRLTVSEWYVIREGKGRMRIGGSAPFDVAAGDCVRIPAGLSQCITNTGDTDLRFDCICQPRFTPDAYEALE